MSFDETAQGARRTLSDILAAAPIKTLAAAGVLGLMWGPVLASILDAADRISADPPDVTMQVAVPDVSPQPWVSPKAAALAAPLTVIPFARTAPASPPSAPSGTDTARKTMEARALAAKSDDEALERLRSMTRFHRLSTGPAASGETANDG